MFIYPEEQERLRGMPHPAICQFYLLRAAMNRKTFMAGVDSRISWAGLGLDLRVYPHPGIEQKTFSADQAYRLGQWLVRAGLIELLSKPNKAGEKFEYLKVFFRLAYELNQASVQKKAACIPRVQPAPIPGVEELENTPLAEDSAEASRVIAEDESRVISIDNIINKRMNTRARIFLDKGVGAVKATLPFQGGEFIITDLDMEAAKPHYPNIKLETALQGVADWLYDHPDFPAEPFESNAKARTWLRVCLRNANKDAVLQNKSGGSHANRTDATSRSDGNHSPAAPSYERRSVYDRIDDAARDAKDALAGIARR